MVVDRLEACETDEAVSIVVVVLGRLLKNELPVLNVLPYVSGLQLQ